jgi:hypothetical protein
VTIQQELARTVRDALLARDLDSQGCFVSCRACSRLTERGTTTLPVIEKVVEAEVFPCYRVSADALKSRFPGLLSLLVTYFAIGKDAGDDRGTVFFGRMSGSVRVEAMKAVNIVWLLRTPTAPVPEGIMSIVSELAEVGSGELLAVARWLLERAGGSRR